MKALNSGLVLSLLLLAQIAPMSSVATPSKGHQQVEKRQVADPVLKGRIAFSSEPHGSLRAKVYNQKAAFQYEFILSRSGPKYALPTELSQANAYLLTVEGKGRGASGLVIDDVKSKKRYILSLSGMSTGLLTSQLPKKTTKPIQLTGYAFDIVS